MTENKQLIWEARGRTIVGGDGRPKVMGIVNLTPDSFSDGGQFTGLEQAKAHALELLAEGADLLDLGGESSRPGAEIVPLDEELRRLIPSLEAITEAVDAPISIDTVKAEVARRALALGASVVNDITALSGDPEMVKVVAESGAGVVLMHMAGTPQTMQIDPRYGNVVEEVRDYLARRIDWVEARGIPRSRIAIDPGIGFGKTGEHNRTLLRNLPRFATLGCVVLIGTSRKRFLGSLTNRPMTERLMASIVSSLAALVSGARVVRVHDVGPMVDAVRVWDALRGWNQLP
ncbi:MAG: dihydropteroate synthase [Isosphaeraceae bacterium]